MPCRPRAPLRRPGSSPATWCWRSTASRSRASPTCSASSAPAPEEACEFTVERGGARSPSRPFRRLREVKDIFGNVIRLGVLGISRSMAPGDVQDRARSLPSTAVAMGVEETWFVVERTMTYIGGVVRRTRIAPISSAGPIRIAQVSGQVATIGFCRASSPRGGAVGLDRAAQPLSDSAARWRSPFVLCDRGDARPAAVRTGPGGRVPHRARDRAAC